MSTSNLYQPAVRRDILLWPAIGRFLRWRHGRLVGQLLFLGVAVLLVYDGFTGPPLASENLATNAVWLHYRGFVMLALLLAGNLFCMSCPFAIPRSLARRWSGAGRRWPRALRNKWLAIGLFFLFFFLYEWLDLWASPWLTAWVVLFYFAGSFALEFVFAESPFCKYVCPLGSFNFVGSTLSPLQIGVRNQDVCRTCIGKECVNGSKSESGNVIMLGCGTELFPPQIKSNWDCTLCLDCARACPHDNVALTIRPALGELVEPRSWPQRWDLHLLVWLFAFAALSNAFGMTAPVYGTAAWLAAILNTSNEAIVLLLIFGALNLALPMLLAVLTSGLSRRMQSNNTTWRANFMQHTPALIPLAFAIWFAHYGFHFATGALGIIPALHNFLIDQSILIFGTNPNWFLSNILPFDWLLPLQLLAVVAGFAGSLAVLNAAGRKQGVTLFAQIPWLLLLAGIAFCAIYLFLLPMEMRGTALMG